MQPLLLRAVKRIQVGAKIMFGQKHMTFRILVVSNLPMEVPVN